MLIDSCNQTDSTKPSLKDIRKRFANFISKTYDQFCPRHTARQMADWAECRPNISQYLKNGGDI
jgi:CRISPR system Cascade subunit CasA